MHKLAISLLITSALLITGCSTTAKIKSSYKLVADEKLELKVSAPPSATQEALQIFNARLTSQLSNNRLLAASNDSSVRILDVVVNKYTMRHGASRAMLGILAGTDTIESTVRIVDRSNGAVLSEFTVESGNATAWGTSRGMIEDHADKIVESLIKGKN
jgi:hypothetical protein